MVTRAKINWPYESVPDIGDPLVFDGRLVGTVTEVGEPDVTGARGVWVEVVDPTLKRVLDRWNVD